MRLRLTVTYEYEADPDSYGTDSPEEMAKIDMGQWEDIIMGVVESDSAKVEAKIEPVEV